MCLLKEDADPDNPFHDPDVRRQFRTRVFMVLAAQLACTLPLTFVALFVEDVGDFMADHFWIFYIGAGIVFFCNMVLVYCGICLNRCPAIGIIAAFMTIGFTLMTMVAVSTTYKSYVYQALGSTFGIFLLLTLLSVAIPLDFSVLWFIPLILSLVALIAVLVHLFIGTKVTYLVVAGLTLSICMIQMLISLQQILSGHRVRFYYEPEDYAIAAIFLYVDLILMLLILMGIMSAVDD